VVYDRSFQSTETITLSGGGGTSQTGTFGNTIDSDLSSKLTLQIIGNNDNTGGISLDLVFNKIYFNCQISYKLYFSTQLSGGSGVTSTYTIRTSQDNITWTTLTTGNIINTGNSGIIELSKSVLALKYINISFGFPSIASPNTNTLIADIYELRTFGSG
jgi:hypothetical protein